MIPDSYYLRHCACPRCGSLEVERTTAGFLQPPDGNKADCLKRGCRWSGTVDDLVSRRARSEERTAYDLLQRIVQQHYQSDRDQWEVTSQTVELGFSPMERKLWKSLKGK